MKTAGLVLVFAASLFAAVGSPCANPKTDYTYERVVTEFIVPGFKSLAGLAGKHAETWKSFCEEPEEEKFQALTQSFHALADAWATIEFIRSGPSSDDFRRERFYFWPERKNAVERVLAAALKSASPQDLEPVAIRNASAAIQGLPALERLLFDGISTSAEFQAKEKAGFRCQLGTAISYNAAALADEMKEGWNAKAAFITEADKAALATDIVTTYTVIKDVKIEAVIGKDEKHAKPRAAEFWRSVRSLRNIVVNLEALNRINAIFFEALSEDVSLPATTNSAISIARSLGADLGSIAVGERRRDALLLRDAVDAAEDRALIEVPAALGVTVGFNSLDGD
jgi:predicted lipoprotein